MTFSLFRPLRALFAPPPKVSQCPLEVELAAAAGCPTPVGMEWSKEDYTVAGISSIIFVLRNTQGDVVAEVVENPIAPGWLVISCWAGAPHIDGFAGCAEAIFTVNGMLQP